MVDISDTSTGRSNESITKRIKFFLYKNIYLRFIPRRKIYSKAFNYASYCKSLFIRFETYDYNEIKNINANKFEEKELDVLKYYPTNRIKYDEFYQAYNDLEKLINDHNSTINKLNDISEEIINKFNVIVSHSKKDEISTLIRYDS